MLARLDQGKYADVTGNHMYIINSNIVDKSELDRKIDGALEDIKSAFSRFSSEL